MKECTVSLHGVAIKNYTKGYNSDMVGRGYCSNFPITTCNRNVYHVSTLIKAGRHMNSTALDGLLFWLYSSYSHGIISWY